MTRIPMRDRAAIYHELKTGLFEAGEGTYGYSDGYSDTIIAKRVGVERQIVTNMRITEFGKLYKKPKPVKHSESGLAIPYGTLCEMVRNNEDMILSLQRELVHLKVQLGADI